MSPEDIWAHLVEGNRRFLKGDLKRRDLTQLRQKLTSTQAPKVIVLACSDSRVSPEIIFDQSLGDLFVIRSAGNIGDAIAVGSIEYAVEHLESSVLLVLGHEQCGAVTAACSGVEITSRNLQAIVDRITPAVEIARTYAAANALVHAAVRENVKKCANDVLAMSPTLQRAVEKQGLFVIRALYQLTTGEVLRLN